MTNRTFDYETCRNLKNLGFNEPCSSYYLVNDSDVVHHLFTSKFLNSEWSDHLITCPTISQVLDWLWFEKSIHVEVFVNDDRTFGYLVTKFSENGDRLDDLYRSMFNSRTDAEIDAVKLVQSEVLLLTHQPI